MPRFIPNGPIIPDRLVQELEEDRVIFFCGAGISMGAGLPDYNQLVRYCFQELTQPIPPDDSSDWRWPDRMLGTLEAKMSSRAVRKNVAARLSQQPANLEMHKALLRLASMRRAPGVRLVTTNFDHFFESARDDLGISYDYHAGPILPMPRNDRIASWHSIVYLHGRLEPPESDNSHLVLTSADFGRAYLTEAWAARFVVRLFSDFTVVFVGYSLNDPVLRYMVDAFAAEEAQARGGISRPPAYIFVPYSDTPPDPHLYRGKLEPISYDSSNNHVLLKDTLIAWARVREDYLSHVRLVIGDIARNPPEALDPSATNNLLWAVFGQADDHGRGAKIFAALDPPPAVTWLKAFERRELELRDMHAAAAAASREAEQAAPPEPEYHLDRLFPESGVGDRHRLTDAGVELINWLVRHLESVDFTDWTIAQFRRGRRPASLLRHHIRRRLAEDPPLADGYRRFWGIVSSEGGWAFAPPTAFDAYWDLARLLATSHDEAWLRQEVIAALRPFLDLRLNPYRRWRTEIASESGAEISGATLAEIASVDVVVAAGDDTRELIEAIDRTEAPDAFWANQLDTLTAQLRQVLELFEVVGQASRDMDPSAIGRPSIAPHEQNRYQSEWARLYDLVWRGWTYLDVSNGEASRLVIRNWQRIPYLGFQRLVLAAIRHSPHFTAEEKLEALLDG